MIVTASLRPACSSPHRTHFAEEDAMLSWRTSSLTLSYGAKVTAKQWFKLR
jgi:hypothetical protein